MVSAGSGVVIRPFSGVAVLGKVSAVIAVEINKRFRALGYPVKGRHSMATIEHAILSSGIIATAIWLGGVFSEMFATLFQLPFFK